MTNAAMADPGFRVRQRALAETWTEPDGRGGLTGAVLERRYRVGIHLGRGAAGDVYRATSLPDARGMHGLSRVALKVLAPRHGSDPNAVARFTHEAFLGTRLRHPNLVRIVDFGALPNGRPYYAMELCRGAPLDRVLRAATALPPRLVASLVIDAASALELLHANGIVHRDVKPANFYVTQGHAPRLKLFDLGVAGVYDRVLAKAIGAVDVGAAGSYGTPAYLAPEQALGTAVDPRADVYGLACVAYRMLTGTDAFRGANLQETVRRHLFEVHRPPSTFGGTLNTTIDVVFRSALEKERDQRTPTAARFAAELARAIRKGREPCYRSSSAATSAAIFRALSTSSTGSEIAPTIGCPPPP